MKVITIGRSSDNDIVINDAKVSRRHLQLVQNDNGVCSVVDLNSANGTFVNGQKITGEVRLQPHDVIRIGSTTLPWQEYIKPSIVSGQKTMDNVRPTPKLKKTWWYVVTCVVFILFASGIGSYCYYTEKKQEKIEADKQQDEFQKAKLRQEAEQKAEKAKRLQAEADELFREALISKNDKIKALAEAKQKEATEAKKQADEAKEQAAAAKKEAEQKIKIAEEKAKEQTAAAKKEAEQKIKIAEEKAKEQAAAAKKEAEQKIKIAEEKAELTKKFYEEYAIIGEKDCKNICLQLEHTPSKGEAATTLKNLFNQSDNKGKQAIIDAMIRQNSKTKTNESEINSLKTTKDSEITDSKSAEENDE